MNEAISWRYWFNNKMWHEFMMYCAPIWHRDDDDNKTTRTTFNLIQTADHEDWRKNRGNLQKCLNEKMYLIDVCVNLLVVLLILEVLFCLCIKIFNAVKITTDIVCRQCPSVFMDWLFDWLIDWLLCMVQIFLMTSRCLMSMTSVMAKTLLRGVMSPTGSSGIVSASSCQWWISGRTFVKIYLCVMEYRCQYCRSSRHKACRYFIVTNCRTSTRQPWTGLEQRLAAALCWVTSPAVCGCTTAPNIPSSFALLRFCSCLIRRAHC